MTPRERCIARARGYDLLSQVLLRGPDRVPPEALVAIAPGATDLEEAAAQYVAAFDLGVPPYGSAFLEEHGTVGGAVTRSVLDAMHAEGMSPVSDDVAACHLAVLLGHAARLCAEHRERDAAVFLRDHVGTWLPAYVAALEQLPVPLWIDVVSLVLDLVSDHVGEAASFEATDAAPIAAAHPLENPASGLRDVAAHLASPARCGVFVTEAEAASIGRALDLPRGFGSRRARVETLLRSAVEYAALPALCRALGGVVQDRRRRLGALAQGRGFAPALRPWIARLEATERMLEVLQAAATQIGAESAAPEGPGRAAM